jgi:hypothetical protein
MTQLLTKSAAYIAARKILGDHRKVVDSIGDAFSILRAIYATDGFPADFPTVAARVGLVDVTSGEDSIPPLADWPAEFQQDGVQICVTFVGMRGLTDEKGKAANGARGFAIYPLHGVDAILADDSGILWVNKVVEKEASHVALRQLRNVNPALGTDHFAAAAMEMPVSVSDYVEESTRESLDTSAFDGLWKDFRTMLSKSPATAALVTELPGKGEVLKALRSKAFAKEEYETLESMGVFEFIGVTMVGIIDNMQAAAVEAGEDFTLDSSEIKGWLATRDTKVFATAKKVESDLSTVDFGAFMAGLGVGAKNGEEGAGK